MKGIALGKRVLPEPFGTLRGIGNGRWTHWIIRTGTDRQQNNQKRGNIYPGPSTTSRPGHGMPPVEIDQSRWMNLIEIRIRRSPLTNKLFHLLQPLGLSQPSRAPGAHPGARTWRYCFNNKALRGSMFRAPVPQPFQKADWNDSPPTAHTLQTIHPNSIQPPTTKYVIIPLRHFENSGLFLVIVSLFRGDGQLR